MKKMKIYLLGGGGHCISAIDVIESTGDYQIEGIFDLKEKVGQEILGYKIIDEDRNVGNYLDEDAYFLITVGQIKSSEVRRRLFYKLASLGAKFATIVSPRAYVSKFSKVGAGTLVLHDVVINADVTVGLNCIINTKSLLEHSVSVGDHCHISTGAVLNGDCRIGRDSFIGSNSVLEQGCIVNDESVLSAGKFHRGSKK
mgnify:CR=1 FL=1